MNKLFIGIIAIAVVGLGWFLFSNNDTFDYVVTIDNEVTQLETELAELDTAVEAGILTSAQATEAKVKIITRLDTINTTVAASTGAKLTPAQQQQLNDGLNRLKTILINYQATLTAVDEKAVDADVQAKFKQSGKGSKSLNVVISETIEAVEINTEESVEDYVADEELDTQLEVIMDNEENNNGDAMELESDSDVNKDETGTSTEDESETSDEEGTSTDETIGAEVEVVL